VYRDRRTRAWVIEVDDPGNQPMPATRQMFEQSWPEAMLRAYALLRDLDRHLMDKVHASRATRRQPKHAPGYDPHTIEATA